MKKLLLLAMVVLAFTGCSKDDEPTEQTFFVNVFNKTSTGEEVAEKAFLYLFTNEGKQVDTKESAMSVPFDGVITYTDGTTAKPVYATKFQVGVFNLENIPNGEYNLWVTSMVYSYSYSSCKKISVNYDYRGTTEKKTFLREDDGIGLYHYEAW